MLDTIWHVQAADQRQSTASRHGATRQQNAWDCVQLIRLAIFVGNCWLRQLDMFYTELYAVQLKTRSWWGLLVFGYGRNLSSLTFSVSKKNVMVGRADWGGSVLTSSVQNFVCQFVQPNMGKLVDPVVIKFVRKVLWPKGKLRIRKDHFHCTSVLYKIR